MRDVSRKHEMVARTVPRISGIINERSQDSKTEAANPPLCHRFIEIRQGLCQGVEWSAVITEFDLKPPGVEGEVDLDPALGGVAVAMPHGIDEQLLENDQEPNPLPIRQRMATGEPLGKAD
jgi:hypothetical protein